MEINLKELTDEEQIIILIKSFKAKKLYSKNLTP